MWMNFIVHVAMAITLLVSHEQVLQFRYEEVTRYTHPQSVPYTGSCVGRAGRRRVYTAVKEIRSRQPREHM